MSSPKITQEPLYQLLRDEKVDELNTRGAQGETCDLIGVDLRSLDLRELDASGLNLENAYLRQADLRGVDFRQTRLEGASIKGAKISGAYFPTALSAEEINLSLQHGTRLRFRQISEP